MANSPFRKKPGKERPEIWASGGQRPPFVLKALWRASLHLSREAVAPVHAWAARTGRRVAVNVKNGAGRIPGEKLGRAARFVPSHLRVAAWIANIGLTLAHASATADPDVKRGNALVTEIEPHLWHDRPLAAEPETRAPALVTPSETPPVVLQEPAAPKSDPLASIRNDLADNAEGVASATHGPEEPPKPPGPVAVGAMQVGGYLIGWASMILALPYGLAWALWRYASGHDLREIGAED